MKFTTEEDYQRYLRERPALEAVQKSPPYGPEAFEVAQGLCKSKYRAQKVTIDGITFDSKKEGARYQQLSLMEKAGQISFLTLQPVYELAPAVTIAGRKKPPLRYKADFRYIENGQSVVEDCKGMRTDVYKIKRHLMMTVHGIEIRET